MAAQIATLPRSAWQVVKLDVPHRKFKMPRVVDQRITLADTTARVVVGADAVTVTLPRRAHNPILLDAGLIGPETPIPWWDGRKLQIQIG